MSRIRTIKPGFFLNETVAALPFPWRLLFVGLWTQADREGRLEDRPQRLKAALFPYDDLKIDDGLGCLANAGLIIRYEGQGRKLIAIPTWARHQKPHVREVDSELAAPLELKAQPGHCPARQEGKGREGNGERSTSVALRASFERLWAEYPRHVGKDAAFTEWKRLKPDDELTNRMIAAVQVQKRSWDDVKFIPHPRTWLHQGRWKDEVQAPKQRAAALGENQYSGPCPGRHTPRCASAKACGDKMRAEASK